MSEANPSKLRKWLNQNSMIVTIITMLVLVGSIAAIIMYNRPPVYEALPVYYYDLETNELFTGLSDAIPPITAPSGKIGVRAYVFSCTSCDDAESRFIGYLETYTPEAKSLLTRPTSELMAGENEGELMLLEQGHLVRSLESEGWVPETSDPGFAITDAAFERCGPDAMIKSCEPPAN